MTHDDEQWDDLAILKAFDAALNKQKAEATAAVPSKSKKKATAATTQQHFAPARASPPASPTPAGIEHRPTTPHIPQQAAAHYPPPSPYTAHPPQEALRPHEYYGYAHSHFDHSSQAPSPFAATPPQSSHQTPASYADAYARAYAHAMTHGQGSQIPPTQPSFNAHQHPHVPSTSPAGGSFGPGMSLPAMDGDEDLSKLLLSWYQSGYYAGRYKAIQEMKQQMYHR